MSGNPYDWNDLEASLSGTFCARAKGFPGSGFVLSGREEFGTLRLEGPDGATFEAGGISARMERSGPGHRMLTAGAETLSAGRGRSGLWIESGGASYEVSVSLLRNAASARSEQGREVARVSGGLASRGYSASFEKGCLPVAVFLLFLVAAARRRAFRIGTAASAGR